jgi:hypothetical protein
MLSFDSKQNINNDFIFSYILLIFLINKYLIKLCCNKDHLFHKNVMKKMNKI